MQHRTGKKNVEPPRQTNVTSIHDLKFQIRMFAGRKSLSRKMDHLQRSVNSGDRTL